MLNPQCLLCLVLLAILEKRRFLCFYIIKSIAQKGYFGPKKSTGLAGGVREGQNIAQNGPCFWLWSPLEAPKWVKDPGNGLNQGQSGGSFGVHQFRN